MTLTRLRICAVWSESLLFWMFRTMTLLYIHRFYVRSHPASDIWFIFSLTVADLRGNVMGMVYWPQTFFSLFSSPGAINLSFFSSCQKPETSCMHITCYMYMYTGTFCTETLRPLPYYGVQRIFFNDIIIQSNTAQYIAPPRHYGVQCIYLFFSMIL